jgi:hypothetical protein
MQPATDKPALAAQNGTSTKLSYDQIVAALRKRSFAVLATVDEHGQPHAVGVEYGVLPDGRHVYVMTRRHLKKARNIAVNPKVALVVPMTRRFLWFLPPPCIQFGGIAEILDDSDPGGVETFKSFFMGRRILKMYDEARERGETRTCFLRITPDPVIDTYMLGHSLLQLMQRMEAGQERVTLPQSL